LIPKTVLVVDDEREIVDMIGYNLRKHGYQLLRAFDGIEALDQANRQPDLIVLDVLLPKLDGFAVLRELKQNASTSRIPVIILTAKSSDTDEVVGLELGAHDYIIKPVSIPRLIARVKLALRSPEPAVESSSGAVSVGAITVSPARHVVEVDGREVFFPRKEFDILLYLVMHPNRVINRDALLDKVWGPDVQVVSRSVDVHIRRIRMKLGHHAEHIETVTGVGYRMRQAQ
jgi:two-component system alkaline phosphatase synthesis response regulator PhoP